MTITLAARRDAAGGYGRTPEPFDRWILIGCTMYLLACVLCAAAIALHVV